MSDAEQQPRPARRLVERTIVALEHRGSAQSSDEVADWDAALGKICADADALDAKNAALVAAAERILEWRASPIMDGETLEDAERWAKVLYGELRAALDAAKGE